VDYKEANKTLVNQEPVIRIRVRDNENNKWLDRIPIKFNSDGAVYCVSSRWERGFLSGEAFNVTIWKLWELIPEKISRPITGLELRERGATYIFADGWYHPLSINTEHDLLKWRGATMTISDAHEKGYGWSCGGDEWCSFLVDKETQEPIEETPVEFGKLTADDYKAGDCVVWSGNGQALLSIRGIAPDNFECLESKNDAYDNLWDKHLRPALKSEAEYFKNHNKNSCVRLPDGIDLTKDVVPQLEGRKD
jgi:hypothetical protein